jgi:predicted nuclease of predicted toxin-antitoxin system
LRAHARHRRLKPQYDFFVDECVSSRTVPPVLRADGHTVYLERQEFGEGAQDVDWLPPVGSRGWILITKDKNIRKRPLEMKALLGGNVRAFVLTAGNLRGEQQAEIFAKALPKMLRILAKTPAPFVAHVTATAQVEVIDIARYLRPPSP